MACSKTPSAWRRRRRFLTPSAMDLIKINDDFTMTATKIEEELRKEVVLRFPLDEKKIEKPEVIRRKDRVILRFIGEAMFPGQTRDRPTISRLPRLGGSTRCSQQGEHDHRGAHRQRLVSNAPSSSNSDLSTARAAQVAGYITSVQRFERCVCSVIGKGPYEPLHRNNTRKGVAQKTGVLRFNSSKIWQRRAASDSGRTKGSASRSAGKRRRHHDLARRVQTATSLPMLRSA